MDTSTNIFPDVEFLTMIYIVIPATLWSAIPCNISLVTYIFSVNTDAGLRQVTSLIFYGIPRERVA